MSPVHDPLVAKIRVVLPLTAPIQVPRFSIWVRLLLPPLERTSPSQVLPISLKMALLFQVMSQTHREPFSLLTPPSFETLPVHPAPAPVLVTPPAFLTLSRTKDPARKTDA